MAVRAFSIPSRSSEFCVLKAPAPSRRLVGPAEHAERIKRARRMPTSASSVLAAMAGTAPSIRRSAASSMIVWRVLPKAWGSRASSAHPRPCLPFASTSLWRLASGPHRLQTRHSTTPAPRTRRRIDPASRGGDAGGLEPCWATCSTLGSTAASPRSARARSNMTWRSGVMVQFRSQRFRHLVAGQFACRAQGDSEDRSVPGAQLFHQENSISPPRQNRPAVASSRLCLGTSALRTASYNWVASANFPSARNRSRIECRLPPPPDGPHSAASQRLIEPGRRVPPMFPRATAARRRHPRRPLSTSRRAHRPLWGRGERRWSHHSDQQVALHLSNALRSASSAAGPGIASRAIRAHDRDRSASNGASEGTASWSP